MPFCRHHEASENVGLLNPPASAPTVLVVNGEAPAENRWYNPWSPDIKYMSMHACEWAKRDLQTHADHKKRETRTFRNTQAYWREPSVSIVQFLRVYEQCHIPLHSIFFPSRAFTLLLLPSIHCGIVSFQYHCLRCSLLIVVILYNPGLTSSSSRINTPLFTAFQSLYTTPTRIPYAKSQQTTARDISYCKSYK